MQTTLTRRRLLGSLAGGLCFAGCATFHPFPQTDSDVSPSDTAEAAPLQIDPVEGQPGGALLRLHATQPPESDAEVTLYRRSPDGETRTLRTTRLTATSAKRLADSGLQFVDRSIDQSGVYTYRLRLRCSGRADRWSPPVSVDWHSPPPKPERVDCRAVGSELVEIQWAPDHYGALIFRKSLTNGGGDFIRTGRWNADARGLAVDRDIQPDGVYAYRVALATHTDSFIQFGQTGPPVYVSVEPA